MTDFNNMLRTDEHIAQNDRHFGAIENQAIQQQGQAFAQLNRLPELMMARERLDSDLRIQEAAAQAQFQQNKLDWLMRFDQLDMSRIGVESAQLQLEQQRFEVDEMTRIKKETAEERLRSFRARTNETLSLSGMKYEGNKVVPMTKEDIARRRSASLSDIRMARERRLDGNQEIENVRKYLEADADGTLKLTPEQKEKLERRLAELMGVPQGSGGPVIQPDGLTEKVEPDVQAFRDKARKILDQSWASSDGKTLINPIPGMGTPKLDQVADYLFKYRNDLADYYNKVKAPDRSKKTGDQVIELALRQLSARNETSWKWLTILGQAGVLTEEEAKEYMR